MAWYPGATKREIRPGSSDPPIKVIGAILHVDAGNNTSLYNYFNGPSGGIESHFHVVKVDRPEQYRDTGYEADANYKANSFWEDGVRKGYVSIETQGLEYGKWNAHQIAEIKSLLLWLSRVHGFPLRKCRHPRDPGVGYHTMFGAPSAWTPVSKSCPGPDRKQQFNEVFVPWFASANTPPPEKDWFDMATEKDLVDAVAKAIRPMAVRIEESIQNEAKRDADAAERAHLVGKRIEELFGIEREGRAELEAAVAELRAALLPTPPPEA